MVGRGFHRAHGEAHAEAVALREAGERARGGTLYVTLEPCAHHGRTPPCVDAVLASGVRRVVACHVDPDPRTAGQSFRRLRESGVEVEWGVLDREAIELNLRFVISKLLRPPRGHAQVGDEPRRQDRHRQPARAAGSRRRQGRRWALGLREEHDAMLVGSGTVLADDPRSTVAWAGPRRPTRASCSIAGCASVRGARLFEVPGPVLIYTESRDAPRRARWSSAVREVVELATVTPRAVLDDLHRRGIQSVLVEGGGEVLAAFLADGPVRPRRGLLRAAPDRR